MDSRNPEKKPDAETFRMLTHENNNFFLWPSVKPKPTYNDTAASAAHNAQTAAIATAPWITASGIQMLTAKGDFISPLLNVIGIPFTIGGVVIDVAKAPVCVAVATEEAIRAGIMKVTSLLLDPDANEEEMKEIFNSFLLRMKETATILIALKLENEDVLNRKLLSGDIEDLVALTLLNTAYHSRNFPGGLLLASNKTLSADNCPPKGRPLFDNVMTLKDKINRALATPGYKSEDEQEREDARTVCKWINDIKNGRLVTATDRPDATEHELAVINDIIRDIASLKTLGMQALPVTPEAAATSISSVGRRP